MAAVDGILGLGFHGYISKMRGGFEALSWMRKRLLISCCRSRPRHMQLAKNGRS